LTPSADPGFAVYVHWPFCQAKCPYCDFNSHVRQGGINEARFRSAYLAELDHMRELTGPREVSSIFFGGGTPSRMLPETCAAILERIAKNWSLNPDCEITLEANPTSVEADKFAGFRAAGVNRVSVGLQALNDAVLKSLGRTHSVDEGLAALAIAKEHFERVSFDLIYARPRQTLALWEKELAQALGLAAGHMSLYQLTIEPGTPFAALQKSGKLVCPDEGLARDFYVMTQEMCSAAGLPAYEVSNHAAPGQESRHNMIYWRMGDYAGIGPGAHGRLAFDGARHATATILNPEDWAERVLAQGHGIETTERLVASDIAEEYLLMGMRLTEGISLSRYAGLGGEVDYLTIATLETDGLVRVDGDRLTATPDGRLVLNSVIAALAG
jgi:oxygen-independent coproporphyrinogen-3 oxidase